MNTRAQDGRLEGAARILWIALLITAAANVLVQFRGEVAIDEGSFFYVGKAMRGGLMLYRDLWDHKTPGVYLYTALFAGFPMWIPLARIALLASGAWASFLVVKALIPEGKTSFLRVAVPFIAISGLPAFFGHAVVTTRLEAVFLGFAWAAVLVARRDHGQEAFSPIREMCVTAGGGAAFCFAAACHPLAIIHGLPLLAALVFRPGSEKSRIKSVTTILGFGIGFLFLAMVFYVWLQKSGLFGGFMDQAVRANARIAGHKSMEDTYNALIGNLGVLMLASYSVFGVLAFLLTKAPWPRRSAILFYCGTGVFAYLEGATAAKFFFHHYADFVFILSTLFALSLPWLLERIQSGDRSTARTIAAMVLVPLFAISLPHLLLETLKGVRQPTPQTQIAGLMQGLPAGSYVWSANPGAELYLSGDVRPASKHFYVSGDELTAVPDLFKDVVSDFNNTPPRLIVLPSSWVSGDSLKEDCPEPIKTYMQSHQFAAYASGPTSTKFFKPKDSTF